MQIETSGTLLEVLDIKLIESGPDRVVLEMPISPKVHQYFGILHGGASAVLAESAASIGAQLNCADGSYPVGIELNISHLRARRDGTLTATALPVRTGRTVHVWTVDLDDEKGARVATARCTLSIRKVSE
jgi:1,4-dihydroxy-2-naphthoyl-CoA hydrolase